MVLSLFDITALIFFLSLRAEDISVSSAIHVGEMVVMLQKTPFHIHSNRIFVLISFRATARFAPP